jgi:hypothetical protein
MVAMRGFGASHHLAACRCHRDFQTGAQAGGLRHPVRARLQSCSHGQSAGQIFRAGAIAALLAAARLDLAPIAQQQGADPHRAAEFVSAQHRQIGAGQSDLACP